MACFDPQAFNDVRHEFGLKLRRCVSAMPAKAALTDKVFGHVLRRLPYVVDEGKHNHVKPRRLILPTLWGESFRLRDEHSELGGDIGLEATQRQGMSIQF